MIKPSLQAIRSAFAIGNVMWRTHAQERMLERNISRQDVKAIIDDGEIIETYEADKPFPSHLIYGKSNGRVLHVVVAWNEDKQLAYVITVYEPDERYFEADLKSRRRSKHHDEGI